MRPHDNIRTSHFNAGNLPVTYRSWLYDIPKQKHNDSLTGEPPNKGLFGVMWFVSDDITVTQICVYNSVIENTVYQNRFDDDNKFIID